MNYVNFTTNCAGTPSYISHKLLFHITSYLILPRNYPESKTTDFRTDHHRVPAYLNDFTSESRLGFQIIKFLSLLKVKLSEFIKTTSLTTFAQKLPQSGPNVILHWVGGNYGS